VRSSVGGRVCAVGENVKLGKYVIIDCGLDIKLWYFGLSETTVSLGELIAVGDVLGTTDALALELGEGFYIMASCGNNVIDPKYIFEKVI